MMLKSLSRLGFFNFPTYARRTIDNYKRRSIRSVSSSSWPNPLPATFIRGGTSKGIFLNRRHLPRDRESWTPILLGIMGSPDPVHGRQLNGMGGGISSLSKVCVVGEASEEQKASGLDVEYTFCQVGIRDSVIDYSGNCGNLSSMIGVFAVDERICAPRTSPETPSIGTVRSFNTNTNKRIDTTFPILEEKGNTPVLDLPQASVAGVPGKASRIDLDFVSPAGARTGKLLPTGNPVDILSVKQGEKQFKVNATLIDATNPTVFILAEDLADVLQVPVDKVTFTTEETETVIENIRQAGAIAMGLDPSAKAQPKIAALGQPSGPVDEDPIDIVANAYSMGILHKAIPMTLGLCLGVAARTPGTIPYRIAQHRRKSNQNLNPTSDGELVTIRHPSGTVDVGAVITVDGVVQSAKVVRTGRRLMKGFVWW